MLGVWYILFRHFSPVAKLAFIHLFISLLANHHWLLHQLDVKNTFLYGNLQEEVYMCRFKKSLYSLKQAPRAWFGRFSQAVLEFGLQRSNFDHSVLFHYSERGGIFLVV